MTSEFPDYARSTYTLVRSGRLNVASSRRKMTDCDIAELIDLKFVAGAVVYLNADVRKHALITLSHHNGVF